MLGGARRHQFAVGVHGIDRHNVVAGGTERAHQPAVAAGQGQTGDADLGIGAARNSKTECLRRMVHVAPGDVGLGADRAAIGRKMNPLHARQVDHQSVIAQ
jgi:hypothetical protein